ncbi:unnamed protein product [Lymnaea stagnalis]|uniref:Catalase core domain-containing protein n=1 Tax=Lymnaea stagnalis TaxID=6523 RepID=A0AAV2I3A5_LYMST
MNMPVFFIRDPPLFPSLIHAMKRNPVTHLKDADAFWDFMSLRPETTHLLLMLFSARGIPLNFRQMHGYGVHAFKLINKNGNVFYCKFHIKTNQGVKNLTPEDAEKQIIADPDNATHDLYNAIGDKQLPVWTVYMQVMSEEDAYSITKYNPFDPTKVWPHKEFPLIQVGKLTLNRNPKNYFSEVEQMAFSPAHLVPGIEPSPDLLLQGRMFAYSDAHRYRLGVNYLQIPVNTSPALKIKHYMRDGLMSGENQEGAPNYHPNSFNGPVEKPGLVESNIFIPETEAQRFLSETDSDFIQAKVFYSSVLSDEGRNVLVWNIAESLKKAHANIQEQALKNFTRVDAGLARKVEERLSYYKNTCEA